MKFISTLFLSFIFTISFAQKVTLEQGNLAFLKGQKSINIDFDYSKMAVGEFPLEQEYTDKKVDEYNIKEAGKGDQWLKSWETAKAKAYPEKFYLTFDETAGTKKLFFSKEHTATYTLTVKTIFLEPGYDVGVANYPALLNIDFIFTDATGKTLAILSVKKVPGELKTGYDSNFKGRISEAYSNAGWIIGAYLAKKAL